MSESDSEAPRTLPKSRILSTFRRLIRARITAGLLVVLPLYLTFLLITFVFGLMRDSSIGVVDAYLRSPAGVPILEKWETEQVDPITGEVILDAKGEPVQVTLRGKLEALQQRLGRRPDVAEFYEILPLRMQLSVSIVSVLLTVILLYGIGLFAANLIGRRVIYGMESLVDKVPLVKTVYRSSKQILATFTGEQGQSFQRVALIPFPQEKMRCVGFITATFPDSVTGEELATVFIPTTPNPTTGYLQVLKRKELVELDWSVEDAVRVIMSGGILRPDFLTLVPNAGREDLEKPGSQSSERLSQPDNPDASRDA